jgi:hypothetical protein
MRVALTLVRAVTALALVLLSIAPAVSGQADTKIEAELREVLQQYSLALESLDADAVKKLQPSMDLETLKKAFREMRALDVTIDNVKILSVDVVMARISCRVSQTLTPKAGSRQTTTVTRVLRLRKGPTSWVIDAFER